MDDEVRKQIFEDFKKMITTESVVGEPIYLGDATIVPFVDISFGFGSGAHGSSAAGGAGGGKVTPTAVLILKGERVELFSIKNAAANNTIDKVINMVPEVISHFTKKKEKKEEVREAALKEAKEAMAEEAETAALEAKGNQ
ncbi:GerW family sporulation protein [Dialister sp.]|uniref:GerW family sporulation protein n=1 Tax=Dialister sp. TaxID=1955814 RepID=UPI003F0D3C42